MRVLLVHNFTQDYAAGGEAFVVQDEMSLLQQHEHDVALLKCANAEAMNASAFEKMRYFLRAPWSKKGYRCMKEKIREHKPDIIHVHNFFMLLSPAIFLAASEEGIPVVATLHNYRYVVPCSQMIRRGKLCTICLGKNPWRILVHRCYRNSFLASLLRYRFYYLSQKNHNWWRYIDTFIALTSAQKDILVQGGVPEIRISVKGNSIPEPDEVLLENATTQGAVFAGRLDVEKGVRTLLEAWADIDYPLTIVGDGPLKEEVVVAARKNPNISYGGRVNRSDLMKLFSVASFVIVPSIYHEPFGLVNLEAMALKKPVLGARIGAMSVLIQHGETGLLFAPHDAADLAEKARLLICDQELCEKMGQKARSFYLEEYTPDKNYERLVGIYDQVLHRNTSRIQPNRCTSELNPRN